MPAFLLWSVAAVVAGPIVGVLASQRRFGHGIWSLVGALVVPAALVGESALYLAESAQYFGNDPWRDGVLLALVGIGVILGTWMLLRWRVRGAQLGRLDETGGTPAGAPPETNLHS